MDRPFLCPKCRSACALQDDACPSADCQFDLKWLRHVPELRRALADWNASGLDANDGAPAPPPIGAGVGDAKHGDWRLIDLPEKLKQVRISGKKSIDLGWNYSCEIPLPHDPQVEKDHCVLARQPGTQDLWIVANGAQAKTFVNRRPIVAHCLQGGDLVQIGPHAWIYSDVDQLLIQVGPIEGVEVKFANVSVEGRLSDVSFQIPPGEFVGVIGGSGAGKSTLIKALIGDPETPYDGEVLVDGENIQDNLAEFRARLGYVAQHDALLGDLSAEQTVTFAARLRGGDPKAVPLVLRQVGFPLQRSSGACHELSGGESKRLRLAAELIANPGLLALDEPGSGLDEGTEAVMIRLLKRLSQRGCTTVMITHNLRLLEEFDRVLVVEKETPPKGKPCGKLAFDGPSAELRNRMAAGEFSYLLAHHAAPAAAPPAAALGAGAASGRAGLWRQFCAFFRREAALLAPKLTVKTENAVNAHRNVFALMRDWIASNSKFNRRFLLPVVALPLFFALAIGLSTPYTERELLGFLSILASIWMGASLSLMALVDEREAYEHERLLFLRIGPYILSKTIVLCALAALQIAIFSTLLAGLRSERLTDRSDALLFGFGWATFFLLLAAWAAVGMVLIISAGARRSRPAANFILPLMMMAQIVFSVQVAGEGNDDLHQAYRQFRICATEPQNGVRTGPPRFAVWASYATLSRYGDIALRSFAYHQQAYEAFEDPTLAARRPEFAGYAQGRRTALAVLLGALIALPCMAAGILWLQEKNWRWLPARIATE